MSSFLIFSSKPSFNDSKIGGLFIFYIGTLFKKLSFFSHFIDLNIFMIIFHLASSDIFITKILILIYVRLLIKLILFKFNFNLEGHIAFNED